ncbi:MAG: alanine--tRNA ligase [Bacteroidota bacterium]|nr:alanine--tRNA ligase [Bacteroidota bacterium]
MTSQEIRDKFLDFFEAKNHLIVDSAPMVLKNDPTLMFTNAGMNQFKDVFLGHGKPKTSRLVDSQKCLRVSGKHNDLEEVGQDTYHHTMFEMLGNWSFGDYFKEDAINFAWELLIKEYGIDESSLYVTIFEGDEQDGLLPDTEAGKIWQKLVPQERILPGNKKDNFWEMGESGPCGPCSEIHVDIRSKQEKAEIPGADLVNQDHPQVIEIWNLVFIQFNRKADRSLESLPQKHIDTGMGLERLAMVLQGKQSNYDTDVFQPIIQKLAKMSSVKYGQKKKIDVALRVIADHLRAVSFSIADGQLPSNVKAGYVIRRILRRAIRYGYSFLGFREAFMYELVDALDENMGKAYPELRAQKKLIKKVMMEEENTFFRTLSKGMELLDKIISDTKSADYRVITGEDAFALYDTFGFPFDLTDLVAREQNLVVNRKEFDDCMLQQKERGRKDAKKDTGDWIMLLQDDVEEFVGYDQLEADVKITKYRKITKKNIDFYQLVFNYTPFYAESGGQVGDKGYLTDGKERIEVLDTQDENGLIVHLTKKLPVKPDANFKVQVNETARKNAAAHHTATHLMHKALRDILGVHVEQKGSAVHPDYFRFDFSHFEKLSDEEIRKVEVAVNEKIRKNISQKEHRSIPLDDAKEMGAMALFGEKYGDIVRVVRFDDSIELCGGTHAASTGELGFFKIFVETSVAAGIRRIEAVVGEAAQNAIFDTFDTVTQVKSRFKSAKNIVQTLDNSLEENAKLQDSVKSMQNALIDKMMIQLEHQAEDIGDYKLIRSVLDSANPAMLKDIAFRFRNKGNTIVILGAQLAEKPNMVLLIPDEIVKEYELNAGTMIRSAAKAIQGGGGGQAFFATAGGSKADGLDKALDELKNQFVELF